MDLRPFVFEEDYENVLALVCSLRDQLNVGAFLMALTFKFQFESCIFADDLQL